MARSTKTSPAVTTEVPPAAPTLADLQVAVNAAVAAGDVAAIAATMTTYQAAVAAALAAKPVRTKVAPAGPTRDDALRVIRGRVAAALVSLMVVPDDAAALGITSPVVAGMVADMVDRYRDRIVTGCGVAARYATDDSDTTGSRVRSAMIRSIGRADRAASAPAGSVDDYILQRVGTLPAGHAYPASVLIGTDSAPITLTVTGRNGETTADYRPSSGAIAAAAARMVKRGVPAGWTVTLPDESRGVALAFRRDAVTP